MTEEESIHMSREKYISDLEEFLKTTEDAYEKFCEKVGWDKGKNLITKNSLPETSKSSIESNAYNEEPLLPSDLAVGSTSIKIDANLQRSLLASYRRPDEPDQRQPPLAAGELVANFSKEERLALYDYTLKTAAPVPPPPELSLPEDPNKEEGPKELSGPELAKALRDFKRRRQAYRTKVSTKNKSHTEVAREVIQNMMVFFGATEEEQSILQPPVKSQHDNYGENNNSNEYKEKKLEDRKGSPGSSRAGSTIPYSQLCDLKDKRGWKDSRRECKSNNDHRDYRKGDKYDDFHRRNSREFKKEEISRKTDYHESYERKKTRREEAVCDKVDFSRERDKKRAREVEYRKDKNEYYRERSRGRDKDVDDWYNAEKNYDYERKEYSLKRERKYDMISGEKANLKTHQQHSSSSFDSNCKEKDKKKHEKHRKKHIQDGNTEEGEVSSSESYASDERQKSSDRKKRKKSKKKKSKKKQEKVQSCF